MAKSTREQKLARDGQIADFLAEKAMEVGTSELTRRNRTVATTAGREALFMEHLSAALREVFDEKLASGKVQAKKKQQKRCSRILNVIFSDTHYGSNLDPREVGHKYGPVEEARRTAAICRQVVEYKPQYREDTELLVHVLGDIIQGQLHDMRDGAPLAEQVAAAMRILIQAVRYLSLHFQKVTVKCTPGNHGRNTARHRERATNQKWDSIETMIYLALKEASAFLPNVTVELNYEPKYDFEAFGALGMGTHGDTVINPGYPGRSIDTAGISKQANSINNARVANGQKPYRLFIMGHVHVGSMVKLPGGITVITNGCLIPPDAYANSIGIYDTACGQWLWESVEDHIVGDARFIEVGYETDADESLDEIIAPFTGL